MRAIARNSIFCALIATASALLAANVTSRGDWLQDSWPAVHALAGGHLSTFFSVPAMMGPFAPICEMPLVLLSGAGRTAAVSWAAFVPLLSAGLLGLFLARIAAANGAGRASQAVIAVLCLVNPLTIAALEGGHPEEILTAALAIAAIAAAGRDQPRLTALLLGLAIASKQWAVVAILPALMALPRRRWAVAGGAATIAGLLILPGLLLSPGTFFEVQGHAATTGGVVSPWSAWYPFAAAHTEVYRVGGERLVAHVHHPPAVADLLSHPLILLLAVALPVAVALRRRRVHLATADAMALFALAILIRCALDPVDNLYYHAPVLLALLGWDAFVVRGLPVRGLLGAAVALVYWQLWQGSVDPGAFNLMYLCIASVTALAIGSSLFGRFAWTRVQETDFSPDVAQISGIK